MFTTRPQHRLSLLLLCPCLALAACGSSRSAKQGSTARVSTNANAAHSTTASQEERVSATPLSTVPPSTVLARVDGRPVTVAAVAHLMAIKSAPTPVPDPPSYSGCIAREQAAAAQKSITGAAGEPEAQLRQTCEQSYQKLIQNSLSSAIHSLWLTGEAAEQRISVSPKEVEEEFVQGKKAFKSEAEFEAYRKNAHQTIADMMGELKLGKLSNVIYARIKAKEHPASAAEVAAYYNAHLASTYTVPAGRRVRIVRTTTEASALRAKQEIQAGKSFAAVARELSAIAQPLSTKNGEITDLSPRLFGEKSLNNAIFSAKPNQLTGPITVVALHKTIAKESGSGSYVFEVLGTVPAKQIPLSQVKATIAQELTQVGKTKALAAGVAVFRSKWRARTDCIQGYVVRNCSQYKGSPPEDPYTL